MLKDKRRCEVSDHKERLCQQCGSLTHHEEDCTLRRADLLDRIKALELELERAKADRNAEGVRQRAEYLPKLERLGQEVKALDGDRAQLVKDCKNLQESYRRDTGELKSALKVALEALVAARFESCGSERNVEEAIEAIKACGVEL